MKRYLACLLALMLTLSACGGEKAPATEAPVEAEAQAQLPTIVPTEAPTDPVIEGHVTEIGFDGGTVTVDGQVTEEESETDNGIYLSRDIVYYQDINAYESGNPYGEGEAWEKHTAEEASAHLVVNITQPGSYRLSGKLDLGQIRINLGEMAYDDPEAVVNLILAGVEITNTVAPAILFENVYECDGYWSVDSAKPDVDTSAAGANLILEAGSQNVVNGSHVAKIYKDKEGGKKLWKQDGAIYSYMSMNVDGTGTLDLYADNEGLDSELHMTINGGTLNIRADNDGINTNEDGVSVTTINGGNVHIIAGLGAEGDGIDSNGYLVINGGTVVASANPIADAGLDSDLGSFIHGGTVVALGSTMDWAESDSEQVTMNLQFASYQESSASIVVQREDGVVLFAYDPGEDEVLGENIRRYQGAILSCPYFQVGDSYEILMDSQITGKETAGFYDIAAISAVTGGVKQSYTGTDVSRFPGGMGGFPGGQRPEGGFNGQMPEDGFGGKPGQNWGGFDGELPEGFEGQMPTMPEGMEMPEGGFGGGRDQGGMNWGDFAGELPEGYEGQMPGGFGGEMPEGFDGQMPEGFDGKMPEGFEGFAGGFPGVGNSAAGEASGLFYMQDKVNSFSGVAPLE